MAYTRKTWECGETITADALNNIEEGISEAISGGGTEPLIVQTTEREATAEECANGGTVYTLDHTWQEIKDAIDAGRNVVLRINDYNTTMVIAAEFMEGIYLIATAIGDFSALSADGYPYALKCNEPDPA